MILPISLTSLHCWYSIIDIDGNMLVNFEDLDGCKLLTNAMLENDHLTSDFFGESSYQISRIKLWAIIFLSVKFG